MTRTAQRFQFFWDEGLPRACEAARHEASSHSHTHNVTPSTQKPSKQQVGLIEGRASFLMNEQRNERPYQAGSIFLTLEATPGRILRDHTIHEE